MVALNDVRDRMTPMMALTGAVAIATAAAVSSPPVQHAAENLVPAVVHEVKSLPVQLAAYNPFYPFALPTGPLGIAVTVPLAAATAVALPVVQGATQLLTSIGLDRRLAQQPVVITQSLVVPLAVGAQIAVAGLLGGTYVFGQFTPVQALNFLVNAVKNAIEGFVAAERALFTQPSLTAKTATQDVASPVVADQGSTVTLSTASADVAPKASPKHIAAAAPKATSEPAPEATGDTEKATGDTEKADPSVSDTPVVKKPTWKPPTFKLPTLKLPTFKLPAPKKTTTAGSTTAGADTASSAPKADAGSKDTGSEGASK